MSLLCYDSSLHSQSNNIPVTYPSEWWEKHKEGPELTIYKDVDSIKACSYFVDMINSSTWVDTTVATFMVKVMQENDAFSVTAKEDWFVRKIKICDKGGICTPLNLIRLVETTASAPPLPSASDKEARFKLFIALLMIYRKVISKAGSTVHGLTVKNRMHELFKNFPYSLAEDDCSKLVAFESRDSITPSYTKVLSIVDMFFNKFPSAPYADMRIATLVTRYHDCDVLTSLSQVAWTMGLTTTELKSLILTRPTAIEIIQLDKKSEQEQSDVFGYFPYSLDMGMMSRSPYSIEANPTLWVWLHTIRVCHALEGSMDVKLPGSVVITDSIETDLEVAPGSSGTEVIDKQFTVSIDAKEKYIAKKQESLIKQQKGLLTIDPAAQHTVSKRVFLRFRRSTNANLPDSVDITDTIGTAVAVVLAPSRTWDIAVQFFTSKEAAEKYRTRREASIKQKKEQRNKELAAQLGVDVEEIVEEEPLAAWLTEIKEKYVAHNGLTKEQWETINGRVRRMGEVRKGSLGECLRNFFSNE